MTAPFPRYLARIALISAVLLTLVATVNWRVDPLQHYRLAAYPPLLVEAGRFRNAGLARHCDASLVVAGTSISRHQTPSSLLSTFGKPALNLAMEGASAHEQFLALRLALRTGRVKEVIWDVNYEFLRGEPEWVSDYDGAFPGYLYDDNPWNDLPHYLLNLDTCKNSLRVLLKKAGLPAYTPRALEEFHTMEPGANFGAAPVEKMMERRRRGAAKFRAEQLPQFTSAKLRASFEHNHLTLIREFPQVYFRLYLPPFSRAYFAFVRESAPELAPIFLQFRDDILAATNGLPNVELHDLQSDYDLIGDLAHFSDPIHFDPATHQRVLEMIRDNVLRASTERNTAFRQWFPASH